MMAFEAHHGDVARMLNPRLRQAPLCYSHGPMISHIPSNKSRRAFRPVERLAFVAALLAKAGFATLCIAIA